MPELTTMIAESAFPEARVRHSVPDPEMHLHMVRAGAGMTFLATWVTRKVIPELQRVPGTELDQRRAIWVLLHSDLRRVRRVRLFVDYLCNALQERRAAILGNCSDCLSVQAEAHGQTASGPKPNATDHSATASQVFKSTVRVNQE